MSCARRLGLAVHLDGARLANASVATGVAAARMGGLADTVTLCLSKGLGCPLGAVIAGSTGADGPGSRGEAPLRRRDAAGRDRRGGGPLRPRAQRGAARRRPRPGPPARRRLGRAGCPHRARRGGDELRAGRRRRARAHVGRGRGTARRGRRRPRAARSIRASSVPSPISTSTTTRSSRRSSSSLRHWGSLPAPDAPRAAARAEPERGPGRAPAVDRGRRRARRRDGLVRRGRARRSRERDPGDARDAVPRRLDHEDLHRRLGHAAP